LLDSIKIYTDSCTDCSSTEEGVVIRLLGEKNGDYLTGVPCQTNVLDHKSSTDFDSGSTVFDGRIDGSLDEEEERMMGSCFEAALNSQLTDGGNVTWSGAGTWSPQTTGGVCVDWRDAVAFAWSCDLTANGAVWDITNCHSLLPDTTCP